MIFARPKSLRWRLFYTVCAAAIMLLAASAMLSYWQAQHEAEELMDGHLAQSAQVVLGLVRGNERHLQDIEKRIAEARNGDTDIYRPPLEFQVGTTAGVLLRSEDAPQIPILSVPGYMEIERNGQAWRVFTFVAPTGDYRVQVSQSVRARDRAALEVATQTVLPIALAMPLLMFLLYFSIRRGLKPLDQLAADVSHRSPENLIALPDRAAPLEARPLAAAINDLMSRLAQTLDNERRFTADAAHELRTPLAAVKVQTEVALASADAAMRTHALQQIRVAVDRSSHLVDQLLGLARLDPMRSLPESTSFDLVAQAREEAEAMQSAGHAAIQIDVPAHAVMQIGDPGLLRVAIRNLLDNALRYAAQGTVTLSVEENDEMVTLSVRDNGPGVPPDEITHLAERFYRGRDTVAQGSGLGLAIVQRIAELHGARLELRNAPTGGFIAALRWHRAVEGE